MTPPSGPAPGAAKEPAREPLWTREFVTAVVVNSLTMLIFYLLMTTLALYATLRFAASDSLAGLASSMFVIGAVGARLVAGRLVTVAGPRRTLAWSLVAFVAMSGAYLVAGDLTVLLAVRLVHGIAFGLANTAVATIAQSIIPSRRRGEGTGYFTLGVPLAAALGPLVGLTVVGRWGYDALFVVSVGVSTVAFAVALLLPERPPPAELATRGRWWHGFLDRDTLPVATVMLWLGVGSSAVISFVHPFTETVGIGAAAGTYFTVQAAAVLLSRLFAGRVQDRFGENRVVYPGLLVNAAGLVVLSQVTTLPALVLAAVLTGLGFGSLTPTLQAVAVNLARPQHIGPAVATYYLMLDIGTGFGPPLLGLLIGAWGYRVMYVVVAGLLLWAGVQYHLVHGRRARR